MGISLICKRITQEKGPKNGLKPPFFWAPGVFHTPVKICGKT